MKKSVLLFSMVLLLFITGSTYAQQWKILGNEQALASLASAHTNIALVGDVPYVVFTEGGIAKVKKMQADSTWAQVGGNVTSASTTYTRLYADQTGVLYVTYVDAATGNKLAVKTYNTATSAWEPMDGNTANLYVSAGSVTNSVSQYSSTPRSTLAFDSNHRPYIAFGDNGNLVPFVKMFDGSSWVTVGGSSVNAAAKAVALSLILDENDMPWLVFCNLSSNTATTGSMALYNFNGSTWVAATSTLSGIRHTSMAVQSADNLAIAYFNTGNSNRATVITYNRTTGTWGTATSLSGRDAPAISMLRDQSGNLYCSFIDAVSSSSVSAARVFKQYVGTTAWRELKDPAVATGIDQPVGNLSIAIGSDTASPAIAYTKTNSSSISTPVVRGYIPPPDPIMMTTAVLTGVTPTTATGGGHITDDGGSPIIERGLVYGLNTNPTTAGNKVAAASADTGVYTVTLNNLTPATAYYVRAYAINAGGTSYGNNIRLSTLSTPDAVVTAPRQMEYLTRAVVAVRRNAATVYIGWRLLGTDPQDIAFNVYRDSIKINTTPVTTSTNFVDSTTTNHQYTVRPVLNGAEGAPTPAMEVWASNQMQIPLQIPPGGTTFDGVAYTYTANDCSVGDVDGDGVYEIFLKWDPTKLNHNSGGYSGDQIIDCYELDGTLLWRINLGKNINAGPHFTQFMVYDLDGDGKAEMACKTADGTIDGTGTVIGDPVVDYRNSGGWADQGPEYLTVFNGLTGRAMATVNYEPPRGAYADWGDNYGNRAERYVNAIAYLDGVRPSLIMGRGYYNKLVRAAYDWRNGQLTLRWKFDSKDPNNPANEAYSGMGNHQMTIGDVDGDGKDEVINGACAIDDDGTRLWSNRNGHGDALHMTDMDPDHPGLEIWQCQESPGDYAPYGLRFNDAKTGETLFGVPTTGDVGRALAADIDSAYKGYEVWGSSGNGVYSLKGELISTNRPSYNHAVWWDGDLARELLDGNVLDKWRPSPVNAMTRLFTIYQAAPVTGNNDTKKNPCLTADLLGDWREEILLRRSDNTALVLFTTNIPTEHRITTLMHDPQYRTAVAWQNSGYNQPPYPSFYLGYDMETPAQPNIAVTDLIAPAISSISRQDADSTNATSVNYRVVFTESVTGVTPASFGVIADTSITGNVTAVTAISPAVYSVTIGNLQGEGNVRLEVNGTTGITDSNGNSPLADSNNVIAYTRMRAAQAITFSPIPEKAFGSNNFNPGATATSGLEVVYSSNDHNIASIVNGQVHINGLGIAALTAAQPGNNLYKAATAQTQLLTVKDMVSPEQPAALTAFKATAHNVKLVWLAPADDIGVTGYFVYRDGALLNSTPVSTTSFTTDAPIGNNVYTFTVVATDAAGNRSAESAPASYTNGNGGGHGAEDMLTIFPNPTNGNFKVRLSSAEEGPVTITVRNQSGLIVQYLTGNKQGEVFQQNVDLKKASSGMYLVTVTLGLYAKTSIVIVQ
ncbi:T9SS type A sorting domain-containing protein [Chitinophaga sp. sic0106]|uniref:rhamnogalacturonan lyase family protein n=1 Tax=Chitinophaga sp. sic0106 TaxID=2854785 RepID=UPI001C44C7DF|nr:T9SS type A sorting domain-containing protein [Chitinophaga sp. sic0106]MBV7529667.1 T9SS type A sorting domain-containing protein [Chitinophaga sp. sic0106]